MTKKEKAIKNIDVFTHFVAGWVSGCAGVLVSHPLDTVKVRLQTQGVSGIQQQYRGTWHCLSETVKNEKVYGLFKGMSSPLLGTALWNAVIFGTYGNTIRWLAGDSLEEQHRMSNVVIASLASGFTQTFVITPLELTKTRLQIQTSQKNQVYKGLIDCCRQIYRQQGFFGLFKGFNATFIRDAIGFTAFFGIFEQFSRWISKEGPPYRDITIVGHVVAGGLTGAISWGCAFPADVIKCRIQVDYDGRYNGFIDCVRKSYKEEGPALLRRGFWPCVLRGFPMNAAIFSIYHYMIRVYEDHDIADRIVTKFLYVD